MSISILPMFKFVYVAFLAYAVVTENLLAVLAMAFCGLWLWVAHKIMHRQNRIIMIQKDLNMKDPEIMKTLEAMKEAINAFKNKQQ